MLEVDGGIVFWILALVILVSGFMVVSLKNIFHCALSLVLCLFSVAGLYILLDAEFLAAAQVLIYVGAVAILLIFAVMLTSKLADRRITQSNEQALVGFFICALFAFAAYLLIKFNTIWYPLAKAALPEENILTIGKYLMTEFMLPFEVVSVLLVAALIGAIALARSEKS